jgi:predicted O-methyltransferase YrrM
MSEYKFSQNWFAQAESSWGDIKHYITKRDRFLEIGSYEGRSSVWTVEHMMEDGSTLTCVDTWEGGEEHAKIGDAMNVVEERFDHNIKIVSERFPERPVIKLKTTSEKALAWAINKDCEYDFIYIDGSHIAKDVLTDACMAFKVLRSGGVMVFDDYLWGEPRDILHRPKIAIDSFVNLFASDIVIFSIHYQLVLGKR